MSVGVENPAKRNSLQLIVELINQTPDPEHWTYLDFRRVIIACGLSGEYLPASCPPKSILLGNLAAEADELTAISQKNGHREVSRSFFVDMIGKLVASGYTRIGTTSNVSLDRRAQKGREFEQVLALHMHVHPPRVFEFIGVIPSWADFITFLSDPEQLAEMIINEERRILVIKTNQTPDCDVNQAERRVKEAFVDYFSCLGQRFATRLSNYVKAVCLEHQLLLYISSPKNKNKLTRRNVADLTV